MQKRKASSVVLALVLCLTLSAWQCNNGYQKAGQLAKDAAATALAAQESEIAIHNLHEISDEDHRAIQQKFLALADAGQRLDKAINVAHNGGDATAALNEALNATNDLVTNGLSGIKNPEKQAALKLALLAVQTTLNNLAIFANQVKGAK